MLVVELLLVVLLVVLANANSDDEASVEANKALESKAALTSTVTTTPKLNKTTSRKETKGVAVVAVVALRIRIMRID